MRASVSATQNNRCIASLQPCLKLIEDRKNGIFALMDSQCLLKDSASDLKLVKSMHANLRKSKFYDEAGPTTPWRRTEVSPVAVVLCPAASLTPMAAAAAAVLQSEFVIRHYAGPIVYTCEDFVDKNRDTVRQSMADALSASKSPIIGSLFLQQEAEDVSRSGLSSPSASFPSKPSGLQVT